ncbi:MAG: glycoside hydrolase family 15 protein [Bacteroidales bacterium]
MKTYMPIRDYGIIGNLNTTALVSKRGSIDYFPFSRFDSPTLFGALLDHEKGGSFSIDIVGQQVNYKQLYLPDTAILLTRYLSEQGIAELTDFMPPLPVLKSQRLVLIRKLKGIKGEQTVRITLQPRFGYGKSEFRAEKTGASLLISNEDHPEEKFLFQSDIDFERKEQQLVAEIRLKPGDEINFILMENRDEKEKNARRTPGEEVNRYFEDTLQYWHRWTEECRYHGRWQDMVYRSAITLKLLTSYRFGSTVAAATFGLPEHIGGKRNWDYRYSWIRDASFTMYTFLQLGYNDEAEHFIRWIENRIQEIDDAADLKLMYKIDGGTELEEKELSWLEGYKGSRPVRIGNGAYQQFQLDTYGELIDTIFIYNKNAEPITYEFWKGLVKFINYVSENWKEKDRGMWEVRSDTREFLISKVMSWVALDRGILIAEDRSFPAPLDKWRASRDEIYSDVFNNYWSEEKHAFVQYRGATTLDASALLIPLFRMLSPKEPRWLATLATIEKELITDSLVYRYQIDSDTSDGFSEKEGTFSMCSFWYIECLAKVGKLDTAILHFEEVLGYANHLGLFSEQISMKGELLGNFPQAFTHLSLISAAMKLRLLIEQGSMLKQQNSRNLY